MITLITACLTWLVKRKSRGTGSAWRTDPFPGTERGDGSVTPGKQGGRDGESGSPWDFLAGLLGSLLASLTISSGTLLGSAYTPLPGTGLLRTPRPAKRSVGLPELVWTLWASSCQQKGPLDVPAAGIRLVTSEQVGSLTFVHIPSSIGSPAGALGHRVRPLPHCSGPYISPFCPPAPSLALSHSCSSTEPLPVRSRGLWVKWGGGELSESTFGFCRKEAGRPGSPAHWQRRGLLSGNTGAQTSLLLVSPS